MKYPLIIMNAPAANWGGGTAFADCLKEECAWWIPQVEACSMHIFADMLGVIHRALKEIIAKMPFPIDVKKGER
jgi:hypothetical protein